MYMRSIYSMNLLVQIQFECYPFKWVMELKSSTVCHELLYITLTLSLLAILVEKEFF